ncbi:hypothetical protein L596_023189 [Steinernema carpocapsae]|uniref:Antistasin-like domain-containing protein n=1 Tax=Steinernema carpocapsae TaxID=34508 RepID=A0A4U5MCW9_STECR|nr:hypothetical protein L596_023189 [Steinernema carpocapsae]
MFGKVFILAAFLAACISAKPEMCDCIREDCGCEEGFQPDTSAPVGCCECAPCVPIPTAAAHHCIGECLIACPQTCLAGEMLDTSAQRPADACCWCRPCIPFGALVEPPKEPILPQGKS